MLLCFAKYIRADLFPKTYRIEKCEQFSLCCVVLRVSWKQAGSMVVREALLLLKRSAYQVFTNSYHRHFNAPPPVHRQVIGNLEDRHQVHERMVKMCKDVLESRSVRWKSLFREDLCKPICDVDLVITIGGDGTLLHAGHFLDGSIPVLGVNSDPTKIDEDEEKLDVFDATHSTGYLCGSTKDNFNQVLDEILAGKRKPVELHRISVCIDGKEVQSFALNDLLLAHPNPAAVSRFSFSTLKNGGDEDAVRMIYSRSSGMRVCTATGSTAAMHSAGGFLMPSASADLQYMVREAISPSPKHKIMMHNTVIPGQTLQVKWGSWEGNIYLDGSHLIHSICFGSVIQISSHAPCLPVYLSHPI